MNRDASIFLSLLILPAAPSMAAEAIDFGRDIRPLLSNKCFHCHGPDEAERKGGGKGGFRLDTEEGARADLGGYHGLVPGKPEDSEIFLRITSDDSDEVMPPPKSGARLSAEETDLLKRWIADGGKYAGHWSYQKPVKAPVPEAGGTWAKNEIDRFVYRKLESESLQPSPEADRETLIRRVFLDITGLPPTPEEVEFYRNDSSSDAYERMVDDLLARPSYGEHWARKWLDLARYADSAGYADDPARTIWGYRDYVIRSFNENKPYDQFTIEQLAGDLLENPTVEQLVATAFHRNTQTNNEGGTNDEEFRNVAVVDRVNTTMEVWMGTTMACAQCHTHKYDPITQEEYFKFFAILNNTEDADRRDESPTIPIFSEEQNESRRQLKSRIADLESGLKSASPQTDELLERWAASSDRDGRWSVLRPDAMKAESGATLVLQDDGSILASGASDVTDTYELTADVPLKKVTAVRLEVLPEESLGNRGPGRNGNFVLNELELTRLPADGETVNGRFVRIGLPGKAKPLHLAEVRVFSGGANVALSGMPSQSSTDFGGDGRRAIDGNTDGNYQANSVTHTKLEDDPWWEVDLGKTLPLERAEVWNRTDNKLQDRLNGFVLSVLDENRKVVWTQTFAKAPENELAVSFDGSQTLPLSDPSATYEQADFGVAAAIDGNADSLSGWAVGGRMGQRSVAVFRTTATEGRLRIVMRQNYGDHAIGRFRISVTDDAEPVRAMPAEIESLLAKAERTPEEQEALRLYYAQFDPKTKEAQNEIVALQKQLDAIKPATTVPVMRELPPNKQRVTNLQHRGSFLDKGQEVSKGVPAAFHPLKGEANRLNMAHWLVDPENPLTARVLVNRMWEAIFGYGIVLTSEEFGSQGELPTHPELLDWLAVDTMEHGWDLKRLLRQIVTSATYRQTSKVSEDLLERDPQNRLLARGPRFRLSAETIRDQALLVSGLLSNKMYGEPVRPMQPNLGLKAAFGGGTDWKVSAGEDRYRRGLYTTWRRSSPYPSMAVFDAPSREVCTIRRDRTNTPLQALVTLNDPVYVEAAQALARKIAAVPGDPRAKLVDGFRRCTGRDPIEREITALLSLFEKTTARYADDPANAKSMAEDPLGPAPEGADVRDLAAWTVVSNVLLNLDELLMKR